MNTYYLDIGSLKRAALVSYDPGLKKAELLAEFTPEQITWFWAWLPPFEPDFLAKSAALSKIKVYVADEDLSFERFWREYGYKVGKKSKCEMLWNDMNDAERSACLRAVKRYKTWLATKAIDQAFPTTFLAQRRWENEFKI